MFKGTYTGGRKNIKKPGYNIKFDIQMRLMKFCLIGLTKVGRRTFRSQDIIWGWIIKGD